MDTTAQPAGDANPDDPSVGVTERRHAVAIPALADRVVALAHALGQAGVPVSEIQALLAGAVHGECAHCGMRATGAELVEAALGAEPTPEGGHKLERLRLGYCARRTCPSVYYLLHLAPRPGVDWDALWNAGAVVDSAGVRPARRVRFPAFPRMPRASGLAFVDWRGFCRPLPIAVGCLLLAVLVTRPGCRVPGFGPKPKVFIVTAEGVRSPVSATNGTGSFLTR